MPPASRMASAPSGGEGRPADRWTRPAAENVRAVMPMPMRWLDAWSSGARSRRSPSSRKAIGSANATRPSVPAATAWMTSPADALQAPPLAGGDDDGQGDEGEADAVAAVLGLEVAGRGADAAHGAAGHVRHPHPGAAHGPQRQRQPAAPGLRLGRPRSPRPAVPACGTRTSHRARRRGARTRRVRRSRSVRRRKSCGSPRSQATRRRRRRHASHAGTGALFLRPRRLTWRKVRAPGDGRPPRSLSSVPGHECQRSAPACWPATLLRGGVLRVTTGPPAGRRAASADHQVTAPAVLPLVLQDRRGAPPDVDRHAEPPGAPRPLPRPSRRRPRPRRHRAGP